MGYHPPIALIGVAAFKRACRLEGSLSFQLTPTSTDRIFGRTSVLSGESTELKKIPEDYKEYVDIFNKNKAKQLPPYRDHDLSIQIKEGSKPPLGPIDSLSTLELKTLCEFIEENLKLGLIRPSNSSCGSSVLFVKKKDSTL